MKPLRVARDANEGDTDLHRGYPKAGHFRCRAGPEVDELLHKKTGADDRLANKIFQAVSDEYQACLTKVTNVTKFVGRRMEKENRSKLAGVQITCSEASKKLHESLDLQRKFDKAILDKSEKERKNIGYTSKWLTKLQKHLEELL